MYKTYLYVHIYIIYISYSGQSIKVQILKHNADQQVDTHPRLSRGLAWEAAQGLPLAKGLADAGGLINWCQPVSA